MATHLITVLGTGFYKPVCYGEPGKMDKYVQSAMVRRFYKDAKNGFKLTVLLTSKAREKNWEDRQVTEQDERIAFGWDEDIRVKAGDTTYGLKSKLQEEFPALDYDKVPVSIPEGKNPDEIMGIFEAIYERIEDGDSVIFDITHSFRSIPMIAVSVLNYAKTLKNCKLNGIYYGAFEAQEKGVAPIIDLSLYNNIIEWSFAARQFTKYGNALPMKELYDSSDETFKIKEMGDIVDSMATLSECIMTSRGSLEGDVTQNQDTRTRQSIKLAYEKLKNMDLSVLDRLNNPPLEKLIDVARKKYGSLDVSKDYEIGMAIVKLCIDFNLINQGFTTLEETIKTYICNKYDLDSQSRTNRDTLVQTALMAKAHYKREEDPSVDEWEFFTIKNELSRKAYDNMTNKKKAIMENIYRNVPMAFVDMSYDIGQLRNDINHFGLNKNPTCASDFKVKLEEYYDKALKCME